MSYSCPPVRADGIPRHLILTLAIAGTVACSDVPGGQADADSALARDLALANVVAAHQDFNDAPLGETPQPERLAPEPDPAPVITSRSPAPPPRPRPVPRRETPRPAPEPRAPEAEAEVEARPAPGPAPVAAGFAAGTRLALTTDARVCTISGRPGDKLTATLRDPVRGTGGAIIPAGSLIVLEVAAVEPGDPAEAGAISFRVRSLDVNSTAYPSRGSAHVRGGLQPSRAQVGNSSDTRKVATGAVAGAILGRVLGGDTRGAVIGAAAGGAAGAVTAARGQQFEGCLPAGSPVTVVLDEGLTVSS